jgi:hypothetical protein
MLLNVSSKKRAEKYLFLNLDILILKLLNFPAEIKNCDMNILAVSSSSPKNVTSDGNKDSKDTIFSRPLSAGPL